jgi:glyoxylase-like metal-dependent hydrolase (beta-lactamase superfamily II)
MIRIAQALAVGLLAVLASTALAATDLVVTRVSEQVYAAIGETQPPSYENRGHNNNLSFIITDDGVVVVNGGDNYLLARDLHAQIRARTDAPVRFVINENGQGHAFLGNAYWAEQGVQIIAHRLAVEEIEQHGQGSLRSMRERNRERGEGTTVVVPDRVMEGDSMVLQVGATRIEILRFGPAHSPGDISVWLPGESVLIAGDIAFHQRLLGIFPDTDVAGWISSFDTMAALQAAIVVPGHGAPTGMAEVTRYTQGYLQFLTDEIAQILARDGDLADAYAIDQSAYKHLDTFEELAGKNAGRLFQTMEMDMF